MFADDWFPIQVKQTDKVGRPDVDAFQAVMEREGENGRQRARCRPRQKEKTPSTPRRIGFLTFTTLMQSL